MYEKKQSYMYVTLCLIPTDVIDANKRHRVKFRAHRSNCSRYMADFRFFKIAPVRHLWFLNVWTFNYQYGSKGEFESASQISY